MFIPTREAFFEMSPTQFEKYSLQILQEQFNGAKDLKIEHNVKEHTTDGTYQIDGVVYFSEGNFDFKILVECKHHKSSIPREKIVVLFDKLRALNAQKGIFISSSNFQKGAIQYATEHKIALIQLVPAEIEKKPNILVNRIVNSISDIYNDGKPYIGIMQSYNQGINCSHLTTNNKKLFSYIICD